MPVKELDNFRQKYPQYNDMSDIDLATKLANKHPQYKDVLEKVMAENTSPRLQELEAKKKAISQNPLVRFGVGFHKGMMSVPGYSLLANKEQEQKINQIPGAQGLLNNVLEAGASAVPTIVAATPFVAGGQAVANAAKVIPQALKGVAGMGMGFGAYDATKAALEGKIDRVAPAAIQGALSGALFGAAGQVGSNVMSKFAPGFKYASNVGAGAGQATAGAIMAPEGEKTTQAIVGGILGLVSPISATKGKPKEQIIDQAIVKGISKGIRPSVVGKKNSGDVQDYYKNASEAVKLIVGNKENLKLQDAEGNIVSKVPESLHDFAQSIEQTKGNIFKKYDALAEQSGKQGAVVDLTGIVKALDSAARNKIINIKSPETVSYINSLKERLATSGSLKPSEAQELIKSYNDSLQAYYKNPSYDTASRATVDAAVVNNLRSSLDSTITNTLNTPEYSLLKKQYGALKSIEKDVVNRAIVDARKNTKGLIDFTDILSGGDIVNGVLTLNPGMIAKGTAQMGIKNYFKMINEPNSIIKDMFQKVDKNYQKPLDVVNPETVTKPESQSVVNNPISSEFNPLNKGAVKKNIGKAVGAGLVIGGMSLIPNESEASQKKINEDMQRYNLDPLSYTKTEEGFRGKVYKDSKGIKTVGYGFNTQDAYVKSLLPKDVLSGKRELTKEESEPIFKHLYSKAQLDAKILSGNGWSKMNDKQKQVVTDMVYNMGRSKVMGFKNMRSALQRGDFAKASKEILDSDYARQDAPNRARRNAYLMKLAKQGA